MNKDALINSLMRSPAAIGRRLRVARLRALGARVHKKCWLQQIEVPHNP